MADYAKYKSEAKELMNLQPSLTQDYEQISQEDIIFLKENKKNILKFPIYGFGTCLGLAAIIKLISLPDLIKNPLKPQEEVQLRYKALSKFMRPHAMFIFGVFGFTVGVIRYELSKYFLYIKYKKLVNRYLDSCDSQYFKELQRLSSTAEATVSIR